MSLYLPTEPNIVLSIARATAAPASGVGPPSASGAGTGGASGTTGVREVVGDPAGPPISDGGRP